MTSDVKAALAIVVLVSILAVRDDPRCAKAVAPWLITLSKWLMAINCLRAWATKRRLRIWIESAPRDCERDVVDWRKYELKG